MKSALEYAEQSRRSAWLWAWGCIGTAACAAAKYGIPLYVLGTIAFDYWRAMETGDHALEWRRMADKQRGAA